MDAPAVRWGVCVILEAKRFLVLLGCYNSPRDLQHSIVSAG